MIRVFTLNLWLVVTTEDNWRRCLELGVWGVEENSAHAIERAEPGDVVLVLLATQDSNDTKQLNPGARRPAT